MPLRRYLKVEQALAKRLMSAWKPLARQTYTEVTDLIRKDRFEDAFRMANSLSMRPIAETNRAYVKFMLRQAGLVGASLVTKDPTLKVGNYDPLLDPVVENFIRTVEINVTDQARDRLLQLIAEAENPDLVQKADTQRFVREFVSFRQEGDTMLQMISGLHTSRLAVWGFTGEAMVSGITVYRLTAVLDGRTSPFCRMIHGKEFLVEDARKTIMTVLQAENPDDVRSLQPWPKQTKAQMAEYETMDAKQLTALNLHVPPFHPGCRTLLIKVGFQPQSVPDARPFKPITQSRAQELSYDHRLTTALAKDDTSLIQALLSYTSNAYVRINSYMRYQGDDYVWPAQMPYGKDEILDTISKVDAHLTRPDVQLQADVRLYRGLDPGFLMEKKFGLDWVSREFDPDDLIGEVFDDPSFMSFTYDKASAESFGSMIMMIEGRKGESGWQDLTAVNPVEKEVLRKGGKFRIKDYDTGRGVFVIEALP